MSPTYTPPWTAGPQARRRGHPGMRVSDADRTEVADLLSKHYSDGRLDQAEFDERLHRAMNAKTQDDFAGLFDDLPDLPASGEDGKKKPAGPPVPRRRGRRGSLDRVIFLLILLAIAAFIVHTAIHSWLIWLLAGLLAFAWLRDRDRRHR